MSKGTLTRSRILDAAMQLASRAGLDGLTIGSLSDALSLSKSGLFAHFGSKEALQLAVLQHTRARFGECLDARVRGVEPGVATLKAYVQAWLDWIASPDLPAGCPILGAMFEFEARDGALREFLVELQHGLGTRLAALAQGAIATGELRPEVDLAQVVFELRGITLAFHLEFHVLRSPGARRHAQQAVASLVERYSAQAGAEPKGSAARDDRKAAPVRTRGKRKDSRA